MSRSEFHLKLVAAVQAGLADPISIVDAQRRKLPRRLRDAQRAAMKELDAPMQACCWTEPCCDSRRTFAG
jgi:hypothetical protein